MSIFLSKTYPRSTTQKKKLNTTPSSGFQQRQQKIAQFISRVKDTTQKANQLGKERRAHVQAGKQLQKRFKNQETYNSQILQTIQSNKNIIKSLDEKILLLDRQFSKLTNQALMNKFLTLENLKELAKSRKEYRQKLLLQQLQKFQQKQNK